MPHERERHALAGADRELRPRRQPFAAVLDGRPQAERVRSRHGRERAVVEATHPRNDAAVVETHHELHGHRDAATNTLHHA
jgi:hypothetical protein